MIFSESLPEVASATSVNDIGLWSSIAPLVLGTAVKALTPYVLSEQEMRSKVQALISKNKQLIYDAIHRLILDGLRALDISSLRGDSNEVPPRPDKIAEFYATSSTSVDAIRTLERLKSCTETVYTILIGTIILSAVGTVAGLLTSAFPNMRIIIAWSSVGLLFVQILVIVVLRFVTSKIENYE